ncbi:hypothetical protein [Cellulomonas sp. URHB0016]
MSLSVWMRPARAADGGLLVPGTPTGRGCDLLLAPAGARVTMGDVRIELPYEEYGDPDHGWLITRWSSTRGGDQIGAAIGGTGTHLGDIAALRAGRSTAVTAFNAVSTTRDRAPLFASSFVRPGVEADTDAMGVLCRTLALRPTWRPQLADPHRVAAFLHDLATREHEALDSRTGVRRRTVETCVAMVQLGLAHPLQGRPLPDQALPPEDEVVDRVTRKVANNRYALRADEATIRAIVKRNYLDIEPWPFWALMPADTAGA